MMIVSAMQDLRLLCQIFDFSFFVGSVVESEFWIDRLKSRDNFKGRKKRGNIFAHRSARRARRKICDPNPFKFWIDSKNFISLY